MKILVVSDTHGHLGNFRNVLQKVKDIDALIHCGDIEGQERTIESLVTCPCYMIAGNNDWFSDLNREIDVTLGGRRVWITHGHNYGVSLGMERLYREGADRGAEVVFFGHIHQPFVKKMGSLTLANPGSLVFPRQPGRRPSYLIVTEDASGAWSYSVNYL